MGILVQCNKFRFNLIQIFLKGKTFYIRFTYEVGFLPLTSIKDSVFLIFFGSDLKLTVGKIFRRMSVKNMIFESLVSFIQYVYKLVLAISNFIIFIFHKTRHLK